MVPWHDDLDHAPARLLPSPRCWPPSLRILCARSMRSSDLQTSVVGAARRTTWQGVETSQSASLLVLRAIAFAGDALRASRLVAMAVIQHCVCVCLCVWRCVTTLVRRREWAIMYERQHALAQARHRRIVTAYLRRQVEDELVLWDQLEVADNLQTLCALRFSRARLRSVG